MNVRLYRVFSKILSNSFRALNSFKVKAHKCLELRISMQFGLSFESDFNIFSQSSSASLYLDFKRGSTDSFISEDLLNRENKNLSKILKFDSILFKLDILGAQ